jgi:hypothetical protein
MINKISEIANAWIIAANPTVEQKELAEKRYQICLKCDWYRETRPVTNDEHCGECKCPISKKIFSPKIGSCRIGNWNIVDNEYAEIIKSKPKRLF